MSPCLMTRHTIRHEWLGSLNDDHMGYLSRVKAFLESGTYYIEVKAYEDVEALSGAFTIQSGVIEPTWLGPDTNEILSQWLEVLGERLPEFGLYETLIFSEYSETYGEIHDVQGAVVAGIDEISFGHYTDNNHTWWALTVGVQDRGTFEIEGHNALTLRHARIKFRERIFTQTRISTW